MKIVTYNLRCVWDGDEQNAFIHRIGLIYEKIQKEQPDLIAFQEVMEKQAEMLEKLFPEYLLVGHGRGENFDGEGLYTAIKKSSCMLSSLEIFWMSPEKYVPASRFPDQSPCPRTCVETLVRLRENGKLLRIYNVHLDHIGPEARAKGIQCVLDKITEDKEKGTAEVILLGDFNEEPGAKAIQLCQDYQDVPLTEITEKITGTFHDFGRREKLEKIDYIFVSDGIKKQVQSVEAWKDKKNGIYLSDHYPICAEMNI